MARNSLETKIMLAVGRRSGVEVDTGFGCAMRSGRAGLLDEGERSSASYLGWKAVLAARAVPVD
jgi:hypothetical protein